MRVFYWLILLTAFFVVGCSQNDTTANKIDVSNLEGKHFYLMEKGYSCATNTPGRQQVLSWADHLEVQNGEVWQWGDLCDDDASHLQPTSAELTIDSKAKQPNQIIYLGKTYQYYPEQPVLCKESPWCVVPK